MTGEYEVAIGCDRLEKMHIFLATGVMARRFNIPGAEHV